MVLKIYNNKISRCNIAVSVPSSSNAEIYDNNISKCKVAIEERNQPSFIESLGLNHDVPTDVMLSTLESLAKGNGSKNSITTEVKKSGLLDYLSRGADVTTLVSALCQVAKSPLIEQAISLFK